MTIRQNVPNGAPCWIDLMSSDTDKSRAFYGELFGWTADEPNEEFGGYINFRLDGEERRRPDDGAGGGHARRVVRVPGGRRRREDHARRRWPTAARCSSEPMAVSDLGTMAVRRRRRRRRDRHVAAGRAPGRGGRRPTDAPVPLRAAHPRLRQRRCRSTVTCSAGRRTSWATRRSSATPRSPSATASSAGIMDAVAPSSPRACPPTGRCTSRSTTSMPRWPGPSPLGG